MLVAPVMLLVLMPVLQTLLLGRENGSTPEAEAEI